MNVVRQAKAINITASAILVALGVGLLIFFGLTADEALALRILRIGMGVSFLLVGGAKIFGYFSNDLYKLAFQYDFAMGILSALVGVVLLVWGSLDLKTAACVTGFFVLAEALFKVQTARDARKFGMTNWVTILVVAILVCLIGLLCLINPFVPLNRFSYFVLIGISFFLNGALNIFTTAYTVRVNARKKRVEEKYENEL